MTYKPWLDPRALRQMGGIPDEELDELVRVTARICEDPYNRLYSVAVQGDNPSQRMAELGDSGFIEFTVDEPAQLIRIYSLVWIS